jgi:colanic acid/amylovoran biosynthesis glycosyltransferase
MRICLIVNKDEGVLGPSETFLKAHATQLDGVVAVLIGNPLRRKSGVADGSFLVSQGFVARGVRWVSRRIRLSSLRGQDTAVLKRFLRQTRPDVVLAEYGPTAVSVLDACRALQIPLVAHFHGWDAHVLPRNPEIRAAYTSLFEYAAKIVAVSKHMADELVKLGAPRERIEWNPCGAELPEEEEAARPETAPPLFVSVGTMRFKKAQTATLLAFEEVMREVPEATLELLGGGPMLEYQEQLGRFLGVSDRVQFHGAVDHRTVFDLLRLARCYVHPSVQSSNGDSEGTPVAVLEAMAMGLPVVATLHGGIPDVVRHGETGLLVPEYDVAATAQAMLRYAQEPGVAARHGRAGRADVINRWSMEHSLARLLAILEEAVG